MEILSKEEKTALYKIVKNRLIMDMQQETYRVGDYLPSEKQLCELYKVSLITSRRALEELVKDGMVMKKKGKGTQVISKSQQQAARIDKVISPAKIILNSAMPLDLAASIRFMKKLENNWGYWSSGMLRHQEKIQIAR